MYVEEQHLYTVIFCKEAALLMSCILYFRRRLEQNLNQGTPPIRKRTLTTVNH
jgi:hypothetical protein